MTSRILPTLLRAPQHSIVAPTTRTFRTLAALRQQVATSTPVAPIRKPVGAFRGGLFGFLLGTVAASAGMYYYVLDEYRVSNELLQEDIYALQSAVQRIEGYVKTLEEKVGAEKMGKRK